MMPMHILTFTTMVVIVEPSMSLKRSHYPLNMSLTLSCSRDQSTFACKRDLHCCESTVTA